MNLEIDKLPEKIRFDEAHSGKKLVQLNYEKKRFLDCIKVFVYNIAYPCILRPYRPITHEIFENFREA